MTAAARQSAGATIGVDVGGTKLFGVALSADGSVLAESRAATPWPLALDDEEPGHAVAAEVAAVVGSLRDQVPALGTGPLRLGVGAPGMVDRSGVLRFAPNLPSATGADLGGLISSLVPGAVVVVENDATCATLAELRLGALVGVEEAVMVTLGTGIGGGVVSGGVVQLGWSGFAGEVGHMIVDPAGPPCPCGRRGCWERYASGSGLALLAREAAAAGRLAGVVAAVGGDPENVHGEDVTRAALSGDEGARAVLAEVGWWLALGLANLVAVVDPERCVVGGGMITAGELLLSPTREAFGQLVEGAAARPAVEIVAAALGERAGAVGAALAAASSGAGSW